MITIPNQIGQGGKFLNTELESILRTSAAFGSVNVATVVSPETAGNSAADVNAAIGGAEAKFVQEVTLTLQDEDGNVLEAFDGSVGPVGVLSIADTSAAGTAAIDPASIQDVNGNDKPIFVNGVATVLINYTGTWVATETVTLTLTNADMAEANGGNTVTFVDTLVA
ncbi:MAG: hypothetical protein ACQ5SW_08185 [Sphaerochaetaceae bacterium]